jgi:hypothetical protein
MCSGEPPARFGLDREDGCSMVACLAVSRPQGLSAVSALCTTKKAFIPSCDATATLKMREMETGGGLQEWKNHQEQSRLMILGSSDGTFFREISFFIQLS